MFVAVTVPPPLPVFWSWNCTLIVVASCGSGSLPKRAPAHVFWSSTTIVHERASAGAHGPFHPLKSPPVTVSCTREFAAKPCSHPLSPSTLHVIPAGLLVTVPELLDSLTPSVSGLNKATIDVTASSSLIVHEPAPGQ